MPTPILQERGFLTPLVCTPCGDGLWRLREPLVYQSELIDFAAVPPNFICDGNSLPRLARVVSERMDYAEAGFLHDYLYRKGAVYGNPDVELTRSLADRVYVEALESLGLGKIRRWLRWTALRAFAWSAWQKRDVFWRPRELD